MTGDASLFIPPAGSMTVVMTSDYSYCMLKIGAGTVTFHATWDLFDIDIDRGTVQWAVVSSRILVMYPSRSLSATSSKASES